MSPINKTLVNLLFCSLLLLVLVERGGCHHKDKDDDDDDDDDDPGCYPGRNCIPGCYCGAESECRPYFPPKSLQHGKWKCRPFNYPKWKVYRKGEKYDGGNSTIIFMPHLHKKSDSVMAYLKRNNYTAFDEVAMDLAEATLKLQWEQKDKNTTTSYQPDEPSSVTEKQAAVKAEYPSAPISNNSPPPITSRTMRFLQRLVA